MYLNRKPFNLLFDKRIEIKRMLATEESRQVLAQVVRFQFWGCGHFEPVDQERVIQQQWSQFLMTYYLLSCFARFQ